MKNLTDFCKMVEISVDPCLYLVVFIQDYTQKESCLLLVIHTFPLKGNSLELPVLAATE